jgi:L-alanine-DL-glutamate epimerase-like enolase superfamily enzyme
MGALRMADDLTLSPFEFFVRSTRTRFPFRYGIASMTEVPHLFIRTLVKVSNESSVGLTSEGLPPKWFTKNPSTTFEQDLPEMLEVISHAVRLAEQIAQQPIKLFDFWCELYRQQETWAKSRGFASLLSNLGVALVERAVLDGLCRIAGQPLHRMIAANQLGLRLGEVHAGLGNAQPADLLPATPLDSCFVRHTVGLGDALSLADIPASERVDDGLPQDLESSIRAYGLRYFKVKLFADAERDFARLRELSRLLEREMGGDCFVTLDGNENFKSFDAFREFWQQASADQALHGLWQRIIVVEQPVHRDQALSDEAGAALRAWPDRPPLIIDESDGAISDLPRALELGYAGTSHKNCKGIVKGIANACLLEERRRTGHRVVLTGEDLCNLGPVALLQDLALMSLLGIEHVERNGHHYFRGLSLWPQDWQAKVLGVHGDLYEQRRGFAALRIRQGQIQLGSVNAAPLGLQPLLDPSRFERQPMP